MRYGVGTAWFSKYKISHGSSFSKAVYTRTQCHVLHIIITSESWIQGLKFELFLD